MSNIKLYDYWRSSASYRVRIALNLKGLSYDMVTVNLLKGEQKTDENLSRNPQGFVPSLDLDGDMLTQSLAIIEYLDELHPSPALLPSTARERARVRALSHAIAMDIHPVCNLGVVQRIVELAGGDDQIKIDWMREFIAKGLDAFEQMLADRQSGKFCHGDQVGLADICLVPQVYNADRWGVDRSHLTRINAIFEQTEQIEAFQKAAPKQNA
ncbi:MULTISPECIES: maleylacetoacetate isomerase [unclassified Pseudovibrio]|uniref:maleylacetoacetate isomerase n=1 Tax=unclassified Pseudovibrio TaxID=2627060 RepID=UPI0007AE407D|nr:MULTISPECIES: maleylacetoacetate isomerase [unclassified Pseudovibrio]KZL03625.1 Maleylpyruvate isomerase [Pseudovibrio sp. W74]KZL09661.1 Maleylpyruvate isomerase [Pseudovibrio sp. Ad14]